MDGGGEADVGFVIAGGDATELLETAEEVLDQVAPAIDREVAGDRADAVGLGGMTAVAPRSFRLARIQSMSKALSAIRASNSTPAINGSTPTLSWRWPGSRTKRARLPRASTRATILVVRPPRDRPMA